MHQPEFTCSQDDSFVFLHLKVKYLREQDIQFFMSEREFRFVAPPYTLQMEFEQAITEDGSEKATYCVESGVLTG